MKDVHGKIIGVGYGKKKVDAAQQASKHAFEYLGIKCGLEDKEYGMQWIIPTHELNTTSHATMKK